jgi:hypothetical protein
MQDNQIDDIAKFLYLNKLYGAAGFDPMSETLPCGQ